MDQQRRLMLFFALSLAILMGWSQFVLPILFPPPLRNPAQELAELVENAPASALLPLNGMNVAAAEVPPAKFVEHPARKIVLGSTDPTSDHFIAVTLTTEGAAVDTVQLNDPRYPELGKRGTPLTLIGHNPATVQKTLGTDLAAIDLQLQGKTLLSVHWEVLDESPTGVTFRFQSPDGALRVTKRYRLDSGEQPVANASPRDRDGATTGYQLQMSMEIENLSAATTAVQYTLRGPVGLPLEDPDNSSKFNDVRLGFLRDNGVVDHSTFTATEAVEQLHAAVRGPEFDPNAIEVWKRPIQYIGVDTQYFAALLHPIADQIKSPTIESSRALVISERKEARFADVSVLLTSLERTLSPAGSSDGKDRLVDDYVLYAGPKRESLLAPLKAEPILDYGWFAPLVRLMLWIVSSLHAVGFSYGLAIIGLTCLVRAAMIPLTMHQARSMDRMKELQPKIKVLHEKYKKDPASLSADEMRQMQEVNLKMFAGCLPLFLQMPIFIALYRALQVSVDLRMAPFHLFGNWIDNLASPDALFALGFAIPFTGWTEFNLLPILSILLMQMNQKLTMPPPADEEQAMQYRMMNIMMYVMVVFFYRVPAGLCFYFIMSSLWGTTERLIMRRLTARKAAMQGPPVTEIVAAAPSMPLDKPVEKPPAKPSLFDGIRDRFRELQELADKEADKRRENEKNSKSNKPKNNRGRR